MEEIPYRIPLVIGATGHRDLRDKDIPALEDAVGQVIERLKRDYLHDDKQTPLIVLSSLAEGADRLIARVAMAHGAELIAPLPMEPDEYRRDFAPGLKPNAAVEFDRMRGDALAAPIMRYVNGNTRENVGEESRRALQYREVGLFIVRHCHVLVALWNGDEHDPAVGGTAEVVSFKRNGIPLDAAASVRASLDAPEMGPVIHIVTPRAKPGGSVTEVTTERWGTEFVARYRTEHPDADREETAGREPMSQEDPTARGERRQFKSWVAFAAKMGLTCRFNREAAKLEVSSDGKGRWGSLSHLFDDLAAEPSNDAAKIRAMHAEWVAIYQQRPPPG